MDPTRRIAAAALWSLAASATTGLFQILQSIVLARVIGQEGFGQYGVVFQTVFTISSLVTLSLGLMTTRYVAGIGASDRTKLGGVLFASIAASGLCAALAAALLYFFSARVAMTAFGDRTLQHPLELGAVLLLPTILLIMPTQAIMGFERFDRMFTLKTVAGGLCFASASIGAISFGLTGAMFGIILATAAATVVGYRLLAGICTTNKVIIGPTFDPSLFRSMFKDFSLPAVLSAALTMPAMWAATALLARQENGIPEVAVFQAASIFRTILGFLPMILGQTLFPTLTSLHQNDRTRFRSVAVAGALSSILVVALIGIVLWFLAPNVMALFGRGFRGRTTLVRLVLVTSLLAAVGSAMGTAIWAAGRMWDSFWMNTVWAVLLVCGAIVLRRAGAEGLATAYLLAYGIHVPLVAFVSRRALADRRPDGTVPVSISPACLLVAGPDEPKPKCTPVLD